MPIVVVPKGDGGKPKVEDIFSKLNSAKYFSTLDLQAGYHHIPLDKSYITKSVFNSPFGKFEYIKVPFGLAPAPVYLQELMTGILKDFHSHIKQVFEKLHSAKLSMKFSKCHFFTKEIQY